MRQTGPPKKPTALKLVEGTFRKDRALAGEAHPDLEIPPVPAHLSDEAKVEWGRVSQDLMQLGLLSRIDRAALAAYCESWADWVDACKKCATVIVEGQPQDRKVIKTQSGNFIENPYYTIKKRSAEIMHKFLTEFGMTPAARTRIEVNPQSDAKKKDDQNYA